MLTIYLHSVPGYLIDRQTEDTHEVSIIWAEGKRMLRVTSIGLPADEAVLVAQSVKNFCGMMSRFAPLQRLNQ